MLHEIMTRTAIIYMGFKWRGRFLAYIAYILSSKAGRLITPINEKQEVTINRKVPLLKKLGERRQKNGRVVETQVGARNRSSTSGVEPSRVGPYVGLPPAGNICPPSRARERDR